MTIENFTPLPALIGGLGIGAAASLLLVLNGRIAGISGISKSLLSHCPNPHERYWRVAFLVGLMLGGAVIIQLLPETSALNLSLNPVQMGFGGLLVGTGTAMANGCTSGHGVCGLGRRSMRSLTAVLSFMASGFATLLFMNLLGIGRI